jgi:Na+/proline symporter
MIIGASTVLVYTMLGGMFSVAITDFIQMIIIVLGMLYIGWAVSGIVPGGAGAVVAHARPPTSSTSADAGAEGHLWFLAAWITMMLGSIPQQDVFQRVQSAKDENTAARSSILGGVHVLLLRLHPDVPRLLGEPHRPEDGGGALKEGGDTQLILPNLILSPIVPIFAQIMFFGALLSAIKSCASATLLAPSVSFSENILRPFFPKIRRPVPEADARRAGGLHVHGDLLRAHTDASIYKMVENAYKVHARRRLRAARLRLYWKRATNLGATSRSSWGSPCGSATSCSVPTA